MPSDYRPGRWGGRKPGSTSADGMSGSATLTDRFSGDLRLLMHSKMMRNLPELNPPKRENRDGFGLSAKVDMGLKYEK